MNKEIKQIVEQAMAPLKADVAQIKAQLNELYGNYSKGKELAEKVAAGFKDLKHVVDSIPQDTKDALGVTAIIPDPHQGWFQIVRDNNTAVSVKKIGDQFRLRVRDDKGELLAEHKVSLNGLNAALKALA